MKNRDIYWRRYKIKETLYMGQWHLSLLLSPWDLTQFSQCLFHCSKHSAKSFVRITISCPVVFSWISSTVWNLFPFKSDFSLGKSQKFTGHQIWVEVGLSLLGNLTFHQKLCTRCDAWVGVLMWWSRQSLVAHSCGHFILLHLSTDK